MAKRLQEYVKYTVKELESYINTEGSCVRKVNSDLHLSLGPYCMADFKHALMAHIMRRKIGYYDTNLNGIVLDIKNIKVLSQLAALRADDPRLHVDINANCYVFRPVADSILSGVVKHVGSHHIGVIIYRVFNVSIRLAAKVDREEVKMDDTVQFRIKSYNLQNVFPYIEGDLVSPAGQAKKKKTVKIEPESNDNTIDSGIERDSHEIPPLPDRIKQEQMSEEECAPTKHNKTKKETGSGKRKKKTSESLDATPVEIKVEPVEEPKKKKRKSKDAAKS